MVIGVFEVETLRSLGHTYQSQKSLSPSSDFFYVRCMEAGFKLN